EFMQGNPGWNVVPRVMFSSSNDPDDVRTAYRLGASCYHVKPAGAAELEQRLRQLLEYWACAESPPVDRDGRLIRTNSAGRRGARYPQVPGGERMLRRGARSPRAAVKEDVRA